MRRLLLLIAIGLVAPPAPACHAAPTTSPAAAGTDYRHAPDAARARFDAAVAAAAADRSTKLAAAAGDYEQALDKALAADDAQGDPSSGRIAGEIKRLSAARAAASLDTFKPDPAPFASAAAAAAQRRFARDRSAAERDAVAPVQAARRAYLSALRSAETAAGTAGDSAAVLRINGMVAAANSTPAAATAAPAAPPGPVPIDLRAAVSPPVPPTTGNWSMTADGLHGTAVPVAKLRLRPAPDGEYDFTVRFTRLSDLPRGTVRLNASYAGHPFAFALLTTPQPGAIASGIGQLDDKPATSNGNPTRRVHPNQKWLNHPTTATLHVRRDGVSADVDGVEFARLQTDYHNLTQTGGQALGDGLLGVTVANTELRIESASVTLVPPPPAAAAASASPARPAAVVADQPPAPAAASAVDLHRSLVQAVNATITTHRAFLDHYPRVGNPVKELRNLAALTADARGTVSPEAVRTLYAAIDSRVYQALHRGGPYHAGYEAVAAEDDTVKQLWAEMTAIKQKLAEMSHLPDPSPNQP